MILDMFLTLAMDADSVMTDNIALNSFFVLFIFGNDCSFCTAWEFYND